MRVVLRQSRRAAAVAAAVALVSVGLGSIPATASPVACTPTSSSPTATDELRQFTNTTACEWTVPAGVTSIELLVVAGGGGGGATSKQSSPLIEHNGGGGGGGEVLAVSSQAVVPGETITITVGAGGTGGNNGVTVTNGDGLDGSDGGDTTLVFSTTTSGDVTAQGGGGGGGGGWYDGTPAYENGRPGRPGGSGGGGGTGSVNGGAGGASTASGSGLGYAGSIGRRSTSAIAGAGHGGGAGGAATTNAVGPAYASNITRPAADTKVARGGYGVSDSIGKWYQQNQVYPGSGGETASNTNIEAGFNGSGNGQNGVVYIRYSTATAPGAPTSVTASASSTPAAVDLTWQAPTSDGGAAITDYVIEYSTDGSTGWTEFVHTASTSTSITVTGLVAQSTYYFRVAAKNSAGTGPTEAATPAPVTSSAAVTPGAPTGVTATAGAAHGTLNIAWTAPTSDGGSPITDYVVEYSADGSTGWTAFSHTASTTPSMTITGLTPGGTYYVRVSATNSVGTGATAAATPAPASAAPAIAPDAPTAVTLSAGTPGGSIDVSWTAPADDGGSAITDYLVEYSLTGSGGWTTFSRAPSTATATTILGLTASTNYYVRVSAVNAIGAGPSASGTPSPTSSSAATVPTAPRAVTAIGGVAGGSLDIAWTLPESDGASAITDYVVEYARSLSGPWSAFAHAASTATTITLTGLVPGGAYFVRVSATNAVGTGPSALATPQPVVAKDGTLDPKEIGDLREGRSLYTVDGVPSPFTLEPNASTNPIALVAQTDDWRMRLAGYGDDTDPLGLTAKQALLLESQPNARARATASPVAKTSGVGFKPLSEVRLYILPSTYLGTLNTDAQGAFTGSVPIPRGIEPGVYTLQANGYAPSGAVRSLSIGVRVVLSGPTVQRPTRALNLPERLDAGKVTTLVNLPIRTNADQRATVSATCSPLLRAGAPAGDLARTCRIIREGDRLRVWISGTMRVVVELRITAPAKDGFTKYARVKRWVVAAR